MLEDNRQEGSVQLPSLRYGGLSITSAAGGNKGSAVSRRAAIVLAGLLGTAAVMCVALSSSSSSSSSTRSSLLGEEQFDIKVPSGLKSGQSFLANVAGHREREITVPKGVKAGQEISIEVPNTRAAAAAPTSTLQEKDGAGAGTGAGSGAVEKAEVGGGESESESEGVGSGAGSAGGGDGGLSADSEAVEAAAAAGAGSAADSPAAIEASANAVDQVDQYFESKKEQAPKAWAPGDTQVIPSLPALGTTTQNGWTASPLIYGGETNRLEAKCKELCPSCQEGGGVGWYCNHCSDYCNAPQGYTHFKLVTRAKQHYEMANPSETLPVPQPINYPGIHVTQAPVVQQQQQQGGYGYIQQPAPVYQQQVSPAMVQQQQQQQQQQAQAQQAPQSGDRQPGFVVSTPDDAPRQAQAQAVRQQQVQVQQQVGGDAMPAWLIASSGMGGAVVQNQQAQGVPQAVLPQAPVGATTTMVGGVAAAAAAAPSVSVGQGPPVDVAPGVQMGSTRYQVTTPQVSVTHTVVHPELQKIPSIPPMKYWSKGTGERGSFRHFDGQRLKVLNVVRPGEGNEGNVINLDPSNWIAPPKQVSKPLPPMQQALEGVRAAWLSRRNVAGRPRPSAGYREYGEVATSIGEPAQAPKGPNLVPSDPFHLIPEGQRAAAAHEASGPPQDYAAVPVGSMQQQVIGGGGPEQVSGGGTFVQQ